MDKLVKTQEAFTALLTVNDNEVKILDTVRFSILSRLENDRAYAKNSLKNVLVQKTNFLNGFVFERCWNNVQDRMYDFYNKLIKSCDMLREVTALKVDAIIKEKKESRIFLVNERAKYELNLKKLKDSLDKAKNEYNDESKKVVEWKSKFSDTKLKQKKTDEPREKLMKHGNKLHELHNIFLNAFNEYNLYCSFYSEKIFPNLLRHYQLMQEKLLEEFKIVLTELCKYADFGSDEYKAIADNFKENIAEISPETDYDVNFSLKSDNNSNNVCILFECKTQGVDEMIPVINNETFVPTLSTSEFSVIALTVNNLNEKKLRFETELNQLDKRIGELNAQLGILEGENKTLNNHVKIVIATKEKTEAEMQKTLIQTLHAQIDDLRLDDKSTFDDLKLLSTYYSRNSLSDIPNSRPISNRSSIFAKPVPPPPTTSIPKKPPSYEHPSFFKDQLQKQINTKKGSSELFNHDIDLKDQQWFHGVLPRSELEALLIENGDFLVRETENTTTQPSKDATKQVTKFVISVKCETAKHFLIYQSVDNGKYGLESLSFNKISELVESFNRSLEQISKQGACLKTPILRQEWEIRHADITRGKKIGSGQFGIVYDGIYKNQKVAIKSCNADMTSDDIKTFVKEGRLLQRYDHKNIVKFIGIAIDAKPIYILMEYVNGGSCHSYLQRNNDNDKLPLKNKLKLCEDCAEGMAYLERNNVVHRDLAARNCLIDETDFVLKLSDFGMTKELEPEESTYVVQKNKQIPVRWASVELLNKNLISTKSDVWSYGITCWEIFSYGDLPYGTRMDNRMIRQAVSDGTRLECPIDCPQNVYQQLMFNCWYADPSDRPNFIKILNDVRSLSFECS